MKTVFLFSLLLTTVLGLSQTTQSISSIDSICNKIDSQYINCLRLKIKSSSPSGTEWQHFVIDTVDRKLIRVKTQFKNSPKAYRYYFLDDKLVRFEERVIHQNGRIEISCYYFFNGKIVTGKMTMQKTRFILKRIKDFLDQKDITLSYR
ncbi:MAG: hypothetical protein U0V75_06830 [Ferruginibacter sp.]